MGLGCEREGGLRSRVGSKYVFEYRIILKL